MSIYFKKFIGTIYLLMQSKLCHVNLIIVVDKVSSILHQLNIDEN